MFATLVLLSLVETPPPPCQNPFQDARVSIPVAPKYPDSARALNLGSITVLVEVSIGPTGALQKATVFRSSGNADVDAAALNAAKNSTYSPKLVDCQPTSGDYLFKADFNLDGSVSGSGTPPVSAPVSSMVLPSGWMQNKQVEGIESRLTSWDSGQEHIGMVTSRARWTLEQIHAEMIAPKFAGGIIPAVDSAVRTCHGTQDGRLFVFEFKQGAFVSRYAAVYVIREGWQYLAMYTSTRDKAPDENVIASLLSLCAP